MRIQETGRILKEARAMRHAHHLHEEEEDSVISRARKALTTLPAKLSAYIKKH